MLSDDELLKIRKFIDENDIEVISDDMRALVEDEWPELAHKLPQAD